MGVEVALCGVEATGVGAAVERFPVVRAVLTFEPLDAALPGDGSVERPELSMSEGREEKLLAFLSHIGQ